MAMKKKTATQEAGLVDQFQSDADNISAKIADDNGLRKVADLAAKQIRLEKDLEKAQILVGYIQSELAKVQDKELPELLLSFNLTELKLATGEKIKINKIVCASISKDKEIACFEWLDKNGFGNLVKFGIKIDVGKGEEKLCGKLIKAAEQMGLSPNQTKNVHPSTLKAFITEQLEKAADVPMDLFGVYVINRTKIK